MESSNKGQSAQVVQQGTEQKQRRAHGQSRGSAVSKNQDNNEIFTNRFTCIYFGVSYSTDETVFNCARFSTWVA
jgi:hypothetical protein